MKLDISVQQTADITTVTINQGCDKTRVIKFDSLKLRKVNVCTVIQTTLQMLKESGHLSKSMTMMPNDNEVYYRGHSIGEFYDEDFPLDPIGFSETLSNYIDTAILRAKEVDSILKTASFSLQYSD